MKQNKKFLVIGGDLRQAHLAGRLAEEGYCVSGFLFDKDVELSDLVCQVKQIEEALEANDVIILPLPITVDGETVNALFSDQKFSLKRCFTNINPKAQVFGGKVDPPIAALAAERGIEITDYLKREELAVLNAVPTGEGTVAIAMQELPTTLFGLECLITGYGRISKVLMKQLTGLGVKITVAARKYSDLAWIKISGCKAIHMSEIETCEKPFDLVINTVPAVILNEKVLSGLKKDCLVIDLASKPGGDGGIWDKNSKSFIIIDRR